MNKEVKHLNIVLIGLKDMKTKDLIGGVYSRENN